MVQLLGPQLLWAVREPGYSLESCGAGGRQCLYSLCRTSFPSLTALWAHVVCSKVGLGLRPSWLSSCPGAETKFEGGKIQQQQQQNVPGRSSSDDLLSLKLLRDPKQCQKDMCAVKYISNPSSERAGAVRRYSLASSLAASPLN